MNDTTEVTQVLQTPVKALLSLLPCLVFLYVNGIMLVALLSKPLLLESPRYILFAHLLLADSIQLVWAMLIYIFAVTMVRMTSYVCIGVTLLARLTVRLSPLNIAVMSLERYVAICFPLRHADIVSTRTAGVAIAVMWTIVSFDSFVLFVLFISLDNPGFTVQNFCHTYILLPKVYSKLHKALTVVSFVLVSTIVIYTYVAVIIAVKSASSTAHNSSKAHKTVLLHLTQLCLCLTSTLFNIINPSSQWNSNSVIALHIQYVLFLGLIILPKSLSPLIYGLRDQSLRHVFKHYLTFGFKTTKTVPQSLFQ